MIDALQRFVGRCGIYIESSKCSMVRVESVAVPDGSMSAVLVHDPDIAACRYRRIRHADQEPVESWEVGPPSPSRCRVGSLLQWLFAEDDYWDGSAYGGFRVLFATSAVERFRHRDFSGVEEFFDQR